MNVTDEYLRNNAAYTEGFTGPLPMPPSQHVAWSPAWMPGSTSMRSWA